MLVWIWVAWGSAVIFPCLIKVEYVYACVRFRVCVHVCVCARAWVVGICTFGCLDVHIHMCEYVHACMDVRTFGFAPFHIHMRGCIVLLQYPL